MKFSQNQESGSADRRVSLPLPFLILFIVSETKTKILQSNTLEKKKKSGLLKKFTLSKSKESDLDSVTGGNTATHPGGTVSDVDHSGQYTSNASDSEGSLKGGLDGSDGVTIMSYEMVTQTEGYSATYLNCDVTSAKTTDT